MKLQKPQRGQHSVAAGEADIMLGFDLEDATLTRTGDDLVFSFDDGTSIAITNFYATYSGDNLPAFTVGRVVFEGKSFFEVLNDDAITPEALQNADYDDLAETDMVALDDDFGDSDELEYLGTVEIRKPTRVNKAPSPQEPDKHVDKMTTDAFIAPANARRVATALRPASAPKSEPPAFHDLFEFRPALFTEAPDNYNVCLMLDISEAMADADAADKQQTRSMSKIQEALEKFILTMNDYNGRINFSIVAFDSGARLFEEFRDAAGEISVAQVKNLFNPQQIWAYGQDKEGGCNYQAGLMLGTHWFKQQLKNGFNRENNYQNLSYFVTAGKQTLGVRDTILYKNVRYAVPEGQALSEPWTDPSGHKFRLTLRKQNGEDPYLRYFEAQHREADGLWTNIGARQSLVPWDSSNQVHKDRLRAYVRQLHKCCATVNAIAIGDKSCVAHGIIKKIAHGYGMFINPENIDALGDTLSNSFIKHTEIHSLADASDSNVLLDDDLTEEESAQLDALYSQSRGSATGQQDPTQLIIFVDSTSAIFGAGSPNNDDGENSPTDADARGFFIDAGLMSDEGSHLDTLRNALGLDDSTTQHHNDAADEYNGPTQFVVLVDATPATFGEGARDDDTDDSVRLDIDDMLHEGGDISYLFDGQDRGSPHDGDSTDYGFETADNGSHGRGSTITHHRNRANNTIAASHTNKVADSDNEDAGSPASKEDAQPPFELATYDGQSAATFARQGRHSLPRVYALAHANESISQPAGNLAKYTWQRAIDAAGVPPVIPWLQTAPKMHQCQW